MKRALIVVLLLCLLGLSAGCGGAGEAGSTETPAATAETTPAPTPEPTAAPTPEPAAAPTPEPTPEPTVEPTPAPAPEPEESASPDDGENPGVQDYVLNTNTGKFHYPWCKSVSQIKDKNREDFTGTREELMEQGYEPCKNCKP